VGGSGAGAGRVASMPASRRQLWVMGVGRAGEGVEAGGPPWGKAAITSRMLAAPASAAYHAVLSADRDGRAAGPLRTSSRANGSGASSADRPITREDGLLHRGLVDTIDPPPSRSRYTMRTRQRPAGSAVFGPLRQRRGEPGDPDAPPAGLSSNIGASPPTGTRQAESSIRSHRHRLQPGRAATRGRLTRVLRSTAVARAALVATARPDRSASDRFFATGPVIRAGDQRVGEPAGAAGRPSCQHEARDREAPPGITTAPTYAPEHRKSVRRNTGQGR
jgi:hypothetical protein